MNENNSNIEDFNDPVSDSKQIPKNEAETKDIENFLHPPDELISETTEILHQATEHEDSNNKSGRQRIAGDSIYSDVRSIAVKILTRVERTDSYLDKLIDADLKNENLNDYDKSLLNEICHGVIRWLRRLDWFLNGFYRGNYEKCLPEIKNTLRVALYQILFLNKIPDYAAVNEAVNFVKRFSTQKHADVVNGLLRTIIRTKNDLVYPTREIDEVKYLGLLYSHPNWMAKRWIQRFGFDEAEKLCESNNKRPILTLRINTLKLKKSELEKIFEGRNMTFRFCRYINYFFTLRLMSKIYLDQDFKNGYFAVQDESAGLASTLLNPAETDNVLDLCAAPGGKATHLAQLMNNKGRIYAVDKYQARIRVMKDNAERLGVTNIEFIQDDALEFTNELLMNMQFDKILLDAPCSGLGTLSKKPDIRWKREVEDITSLAALQKNLLNNAAKFVKPGGVLVYSTCTIEPEENFENVRSFLNEHPDFYLDNASKFVHKDLVSDNGCIETYPHRHNIDGSFAARLVKKTETSIEQ